ncbi:hypothetical protein P43SY_010102 [Pythium insidiosum]|uniref:PI3K/PI4K catalytic domain-containing protein n=1 Tax=Pythium insidiosum TaxID=114742 RepID=A0AAD5QBC4_PYTIN|nr:hypothetical protein P43SY_010102 [Pythium insidiosum]
MGLADWWVARAGAKHGGDNNSNNGAATVATATDKATASSRWSIFGLDGLRRAKSEPRQKLKLRLKADAPAPAVVVPSPRIAPLSTDLSTANSTSDPVPSSPPRLGSLVACERISASVLQAKELIIQQCAVAVSLYPTLVQLAVPRRAVSTTVVLAEEPHLPLDSTSPVAQPAQCDHQWPSSRALRLLESDIESLLSKGALELRLTSDGCGGVYFLYDKHSSSRRPVGVFKPRDEEYMAPLNPRGYVKEHAVVGVTEHPVHKGFRVGNGALRERAVYLLDEAYNNFSGVPVTTLMSLPVPAVGNKSAAVVKEGSVQLFAESESSAEDMGTLKFNVQEVHKIGILDVRLFNLDRHAGNVLLQSAPGQTTFAMTPIDHGFCLPSYKRLEFPTFDWLQWPQAQYPFTSEELDHIASLDADRDAALLRSLGFEEECIGADAGFSLYEIGQTMQPRDDDYDLSQPSTLEAMIATARTTVLHRLQRGDDDDGEDPAFLDALVAEVSALMTQMFSDQPKKKVRSISCFS